jgi:predicted outer membrane protein
MKPSAVLLLTAAAFLPVAALAKTKSSSSGGKGLPPKFGGLIQPAPAVDGVGSTGGLINSEISGKDLEFLTNTIALGRVQSWLVQTAQEKAETPEVRALGGALAEIQADENRYVAKLASLKGVVIPSAQEVSPEQKALATKMKPLAGPKLEKALVEEIVNAAEKSVTEYEAGRQSQDAEIKRLAEQMLPAAKSRLQFASRAAGHAQDTSTRPTFRTGGATRPAADKVQPKVDAAAPVPLSKPAAKSEPAAVRETTPPAPVRATATPASNPRPASATPPPAAVKAASLPEAQPRAVKSAPQNIPSATPPPAVFATPAPVPAPAVSATPVPVPPPPVFTPLAPGTTPPPRPPKPTPVSEKSVLPGRPTPPDFTAATIPPLATPPPAPPAPVALPETAVATEAPAAEVAAPATPAPQKSRKRK